ncbi:MAG: universal stress protein, partial [Alphaproteobacteria bacterium]|nr:universal stress protein [Alphaproteobacteria bacterium]
DLTMSCGRPVLVVPNSGRFDRPGRHVLVCWNASREATRAVNDAMPLLQRAEKVVVLSVNPHRPSGGDHGEIPSANIALHLARHGVNAEAANTTADGISVADIVLSHVSDRGIDLIVAGAWGHSRMREWAFGGVTESLLRDVTVPALMSH